MSEGTKMVENEGVVLNETEARASVESRNVEERPTSPPPRERMSDSEYETAQMQIMLIADMIRMVDLRGFLDRIGTAEAVGILNPTLYMAAMGKLELIKQTAQALSRAKGSLPTREQMEDAQRKQEAVQRVAGGFPFGEE